MKSELNIAFLTCTDPKDRKSWSGIHYQMLKSLEKQFTQVVPLGPVNKSKPLWWYLKLLNDVHSLFSRQYNIYHNKVSSRYYKPIFEKKLKQAEFDVIFAPVASIELAYLETDIPIVYYSDSSFRQMIDYYQDFASLTEYSKRESDLIQSRGLQNSAVVLHSSDWATNYVVENYNIDKNRAFTVTMGANIDKAPDIKTLEQKTIDKKTCNLLFLGVDWERKGGPIAFETLLELNKLGIDAHLTVCGCVPPKKFAHPKMTVIPFLNKNKKSEYNQFLELLFKTHFLVLPTRAECSAIVYAEASAYGIPSITTETGGVASMVENDVNGYRLPLEAGGIEYAKTIKQIFEDDDHYQKLVYSSRAKFDSELNWEAWGKKVKQIILDYRNQ